VRSAAVARGLGVSTAAVAEMLVRLEAEQLVSRGADRTICLTPAGMRVGRGQVRKHRLAERLLHSILKRPWDAVHEEACQLEHAMTEEVTESVVSALGDPATCPHGNPIPTSDLEEPSPPDPREIALAGCHAGDRMIVSRVVDESREILKYLLSLGLLPGAELLVEQVAPFGGPLLVLVGEARYALGRDVAASVMVRSTETYAEALTREPALAVG
jgi:DtxR family Mn-dependent transcriptional regulator